MPVRVLLETALAYDEIAKDPEVRKLKTLPPVLPVVVHVGTKPWTAATRLEDMLADEAKAFLPFALGHEFLLASEAAEARSQAEARTPRTAGLRLRYAQDHDEFEEALATLRTLLPEDSPTRRALVEWVRSSMIEEGAKEAEVARVMKLEDLKSPIVETWWAKERREARRKGLEEGRAEGLTKGLEEGRAKGRAEGRAEGRSEGRRAAEADARREQRATLARLAERKFGADAAKDLATLLEGVSDPERLAGVADLIIDCANGRSFLDRVAESA